jgi:hypothetical protein
VGNVSFSPPLPRKSMRAQKPDVPVTSDLCAEVDNRGFCVYYELQNR